MVHKWHDDGRYIRIMSDLLAIVLRHKPFMLGLETKDDGWYEVEEIIQHPAYPWIVLSSIVRADNNLQWTVDYNWKRIKCNYCYVKPLEQYRK